MAIVATTQLAKVGNGTAVFIPSAVRSQAHISVGDSLQIETPRAGVIVLSFTEQNKDDRLAKLEAAEKHIRQRGESLPPWPSSSMDAETFLNMGKEAKADDLLPR